MNSKTYFDLTINDSSVLSIVRVDNFNCHITDPVGTIYGGFILAKSENQKVYTICDFQKSNTDEKYQARLSFRKTDKDFVNRNVNKGSDEVIIPFMKGQDGYRELWKMISFLYKWRDTIDLGEFEDYFSVTNRSLKQILPIIASIKNKDIVLSNLDKLSSKELNNLSDVVSFTKITKITNEWKANKTNYNEEYWQTLFQENSWILSQIFSAPYMKIGQKFFCGGKDDDDKGGVKGDLLYKNMTNNIAFIEIKTPKDNIIIGGEYRGKDEGKDNKIFGLSNELTGGVNQVLNQKKVYLKQHREENGRYLNNAKCVLIIGVLPIDEDKQKSFDLFRGALKDVDVITFDELFSRIGKILDIFRN